MSELAYLYRRCDAGKMAWQDAAAASRLLREIRHIIEASDIEQRLKKLEVATGLDPEGGATPWSNGNGGYRHARH
jgi:hypothetical protein